MKNYLILTVYGLTLSLVLQSGVNANCASPAFIKINQEIFLEENYHALELRSTFDRKVLEHEPYDLVSDIKWASPDGFDLTMDIYTPNTGKLSYPVIVMFHGGGWLMNNKSIMKSASEFLVEHGEYVVCNVNYRLLGDMDNTVTMNEIIEDAFGAVLWVKSNITRFKGDPSKVILTGDSAGGHLAAITTLQGDQLSSKRFDGAPHGFRPSWLPNGKTAEDVARENGLKVQAAIISYGGFDLHRLCKDSAYESSSNIFWSLGNTQARGIFGNEFNVTDNPEFYKKVSPAYNIPKEDTYVPPMLFTVGEYDDLTTPASIREFISAMEQAGHNNLQYWVHEGRPHAFLDSGTNEFLGIKFEDDAIPALEFMIEYLDEIFYNQ